MEDAATAEISRASIWQWIKHQKPLSNGQVVTKALFEQYLSEEMKVLEHELGANVFARGQYQQAAALMAQLTTSDELVNFLTLPGYQYLP
jgi:malate synthase